MQATESRTMPAEASLSEEAHENSDGSATLPLTYPSHVKLAAYANDTKRARVAAPFLVAQDRARDVKKHVLATVPAARSP
jgi:hypothetical protein